MKEFTTIAKRLQVPKNTLALLWDMDGVLIDSLGLDLVVCNDLLKKYFGEQAQISRDYVKSIFACDIPKFWSLILEKVRQDFLIDSSSSEQAAIMREYNAVRQNYRFDILPGINEILADAKQKKLKNAVVSNNPTKEVEAILAKAGLVNRFDLIIGNDARPEMPKKPAPDIYLYAAKKIKNNPNQSVVIEDSLLGAKSGKQAGCFTVAVATGGETREQLQNAPFKIDKIYDNFSNTLNE